MRMSSGDAAVLKLSGPGTPAEPEAVAHRHWNAGPAPFLIGADHDGDALLLDRLMRSIPRRSYMRGTVRAEEAVQDPPTERNTKRAPGLRQSVSGLGTYFGDRQVKLLTLQEDRL